MKTLQLQSLRERFGRWTPSTRQMDNLCASIQVGGRILDITLKTSVILGTLWILAEILVAFMPGGPAARLIGGY